MQLTPALSSTARKQTSLPDAASCFVHSQRCTSADPLLQLRCACGAQVPAQWAISQAGVTAGISCSFLYNAQLSSTLFGQFWSVRPSASLSPGRSSRAGSSRQHQAVQRWRPQLSCFALASLAANEALAANSWCRLLAE